MGDAGEDGAVGGVLHEEPPEHRRLVGDAGVHDGVVDVGDHDELRLRRRDEDLRRGRDRLGREHPELEPVPEPVGRHRAAGLHLDAEVAVAVGLDLDLGAEEAGADAAAAHRAAAHPAHDVAQLRPHLASAGSRSSPCQKARPITKMRCAEP